MTRTPPSSIPERARAILQMGGMPVPYARRRKHPIAKGARFGPS
jgi:hypothetical protein